MASKKGSKAAGEAAASKKSKLDEIIDEADDVIEMVKPPASKPAPSKSKKAVKVDSDDDDDDVLVLSDDDDDDDEEEEAPKAKKAKKVVKTRKGTTMEVDGDMPCTKKEATAAKKAAASEDVVVIAGSGESEPTRSISMEDPVVQKYNKMTVSQLKDWLRANETLMTGKKDELVTRCVDGEINGRIPRCERCRQGKLSFNPDRGVYSCSGFFDEDSKMTIRCSFQAASVKRQAWLNPEEAQAAKTEAEEAPKKQADVAVSGKVTDELVDKLRALPIKDAAEALVKFCREELMLSLPADAAKARLEVGPKMMTNRDEEGKVKVREVISQLIVAYPPKEQSSSASGATSSKPAAGGGGGAPAKVPANEPIAVLLEQIAQYEKKKGGENVQFKLVALKKAAIAIRSLDSEITEGLALGKPGKKKVEGIGKGTASTIQEFLDSGKTTSPYLESLKKELGDL